MKSTYYWNYCVKVCIKDLSRIVQTQIQTRVVLFCSAYDQSRRLGKQINGKQQMSGWRFTPMPDSALASTVEEFTKCY